MITMVVKIRCGTSLMSKTSHYEQFILQRFRCAFRSQYNHLLNPFNSQVGKRGFNSVLSPPQ